MLDSFLNEVHFILLSVKNYQIDLIIADDKIREHFILTKGEVFPKFVTGGCGSDFRVVFEYIKQKRLTPKLLLYFSDLEGFFPKQKPNFETIWISTSKKEAPFGKKINLTGH
jgi:predicted metal-dependent peptidase